MFLNLQKKISYDDKLYNKIIFLSRNKLLYTKFDLKDTFQNRINLIFFHISFVFIKIKQSNDKKSYKDFYQFMFDLIFKKIEVNMREIGFGDVVVNKNMKFLVKVFYDILLNCEDYTKMSLITKSKLINKYILINNIENTDKNATLIKYFDQYNNFCLDLTSDNVLKGELNFKYK